MALRVIHRMAELSFRFRHVIPADYQRKPWKNGRGQTLDILLLPENSAHANFDLRFALSPISEDGPFSSFPGVDRVTTMVEGTALELLFDASRRRLEKFKPCRFDAGLTPTAKLIDGPSRVINVMARRDVWDVVECDVTSGVNRYCDEGDLLFLYAVSGASSVTAGEFEMTLGSSESLFITDAREAIALSGGCVVFAHLKNRMSARCPC